MLEDHEVLPALIAKLHEEADELAEAGQESRLDELADVHEVVAALRSRLGFTDVQVAEAAAAKRAARGGFTRWQWVEG